MGYKAYELSNHLGNVLTTISDNYTITPPSGGGGLVRVLSSQDYYPFGMAMTERSYTESQETKYRYGFNTQERDEDIDEGGNHYTAEFWEYDARTGRRWNVDPVVKEYESGYACLGNSPIWMIDINGADTSFFDNKTRKQFVKVYNQVNSKISKLDNKIEKKIDKWKAKNYSDNKLAEKIGRLNEKRSKLISIKNSFDAVITSSVMYHYTARPKNGTDYLSGGGTSVNIPNNRVDVWFYSGNLSTIVHETRHAAGYAWKEWAWHPNEGLNTPISYDYQDEVEAYEQQSNYAIIFGGYGKKNSREIKQTILANYGKKDFIIKKFKQNCVNPLLQLKIIK